MSKKHRPAPWLETLRLEFTLFGEGDFDELYRLDSDSRVMKYIADGKPASREATAQRLERFLRYPTLYPDLGVWRAARRDNGAYIGWFALNYAGKTTDIEVGYRLLPRAWGRGFATEGAMALVDYGFDDLGLDRIIGVTHPANKASQRVLRKAGLEDVGWGRYYDRRLRLFAAQRNAR
jgi:ribosomal-protein-alanine N-acetyltransferase